ncbi:hypothetical protein A0H81_05042 [Grifola frondosa]|uniref:Integrase core domain-containing protein n=1 Tax=Grifola frondosa TaxID=5627 RepID=A0A1C7MBU3_GRIFR|nr:hypothetical protein A0H81_05042 [Grifola frondosa]
MHTHARHYYSDAQMQLCSEMTELYFDDFAQSASHGRIRVIKLQRASAMPNPEGKNGQRICPPELIIRPWIEHYVARGFKNPDIVKRLRRHYDGDLYNLSLSALKKKRSIWNIKSTRGQAHTIESIADAVERVRLRFPSRGSRQMKVTLLFEERIHVSRKLICEYMNRYHAEEVRARKAQRLLRRQFWTVGVNDIWCMDQHDKWRRFELYLHIGVEPFSGRILWLKIWWTNRNPRLVCGWYCDTVESLGAMPLLTQSDPGTENNGIANAQTVLRHRHDPTLSDTLQHKFKGGKRNIKPEIHWRLLRTSWSPGFEELLDYGLNSGLYDPDIPLERLVFHYLFIPWLQSELDIYVEQFNDTRPRYNRHKLLPRGRPIDIFENPTDHGSDDFSVKVNPEHLAEVRNKYAPPLHPVFHLVPSAFALRAAEFYQELGSPVLDRDNIWTIYSELLSCFVAYDDDAELHTILSTHATLPAVGEDPDGEEWMPVLDLRRPREGDRVVGGLEHGAASTSAQAADNLELDGDFSEVMENNEHNEWTDDSSSASSSDCDCLHGSVNTLPARSPAPASPRPSRSPPDASHPTSSRRPACFDRVLEDPAAVRAVRGHRALVVVVTDAGGDAGDNHVVAKLEHAYARPDGLDDTEALVLEDAPRGGGRDVIGHS